MTTKANAVPKRLRFGMAELTSHAPANDKSTSYCLLSTSYFLTPQSELATDLIPQSEATSLLLSSKCTVRCGKGIVMPAASKRCFTSSVYFHVRSK